MSYEDANPIACSFAKAYGSLHCRLRAAHVIDITCTVEFLRRQAFAIGDIVMFVQHRGCCCLRLLERGAALGEMEESRRKGKADLSAIISLLRYRAREMITRSTDAIVVAVFAGW